MYQFHYPLKTSLQKTIHNCSTETLTRGPADFPSIPTSWTIYTCYSNPDCSHLKFSTWFFSCNSKYCSLQQISFLLSILPPAFPKGSTSLSSYELEAYSQLIFFISSKNGFKLNVVHHRKLSNSDDIFSSFLYRIQLQIFF